MPSQSPFLDTVLNPPPPTTTTPPSTTSSSPSSTTSTMSFSHADTAQIQAQIQAQLQAQAQAQAQVQAEVQAQVQAQAQAHQAQVQAQAQAQAQAQLQIQLHVQAQPFNATQQSLQSRNKPFTNQQTTTTTSPHRQRNSSSRSGSGSGGESFTARQRRLEAVSVLENSELLLWVSAERNESMGATRQYFRNIVMGRDDEGGGEVVWRDEWEVPVEERVRERKVAVAAGAKGKSESPRGKRGEGGRKKV